MRRRESLRLGLHYRAHCPRRRFHRSPGGRTAGGFVARITGAADVRSGGAGAGPASTGAISITGSVIGSAVISTTTGLALGGRPRRDRSECSSATNVGSNSACAGSGMIRLGRIRRGSAAGARGSAGGGQDTAGRGIAGAAARCGMKVRWWRPPDLVSTVNDGGVRLRMVRNASGVAATGHRHEDAGAVLTERYGFETTAGQRLRLPLDHLSRSHRCDDIL